MGFASVFFFNSSESEFEYVPVHDLERADDNWLWRSVGNDPQFLLRPKRGDRVLPKGWARIELLLEYHENARRPRLHWDQGDGFKDEKCHILPLPQKGKVSVTLPFPANVKALRLDPSDCAGLFSLRGARIMPLSRVAVAAALVLPYLGRAIRHPKVYLQIAREFFLLWKAHGTSALKVALRQLALTGSGVAVRSYVHGQLHREQPRSPTRGVTPSFTRAAGTLGMAGRGARQKRQIGIGLIEHLGDIVACEPVVRHIKQEHPDAEISWVVRESYRELIDANPLIDRTIAVDCLTDWIKLQAHKFFDEVIDLHVNGRICQHCGIPLLKQVGDPSITGDNYFQYGSLLESFCLAAGLPALTESPRVYVPNSVVQAVEGLELPDSFVVFHCASNEEYKDWQRDGWARLARWLMDKHRLSVVEVGLRSVIAAAVDGVIDLCGKTSILETAEVIRRARLLVAVDSGPAHLANAVGAFGVVLLGQIGPFKRYNPFTGRFANGSNATLVRNETGPAADIPYDRVQQAVAERLDGKHASVSVVNSGQGDSRTLVVRISNDTVAALADGGHSRDQPRLIAFYLPQYHPIPENDKNWGKGFTEWRNVGKAQPFFQGQYQPRLPGELGYYDLRLPEIMEQQAELAREHGIHGFCFYYYWFQGKRLLHVPIDNMLRRKKPDFPFCFCWANENWTRRWDGMEKEIIVAQKHTHDDDINFIRHLVPAFDDPRYIRVNGKPLLLVYRTELFPDPLRTAEIWRAEARKAGVGDLFLVRCEGFDPFTNPQDIGFDASYEVPTFILPDELRLDDVQGLKVSPEFTGRIFDYGKIVKYYSERPDVPYRRYKDVMLAWDNTPRHGKNAVVFHGVTPELYRQWLSACTQHSIEKFEGEERLVFINAWNEWAEGSYLEPDLRYGRAFLEATKGVAMEIPNQAALPSKEKFGEHVRVARFCWNPARDYSQHGEQVIIGRFFSEYRGEYVPYCIDAGAYDGVVGSNTRALLEAGWAGMLIEPNPRVFSRLKLLYRSRPDVACIQTALSNVEKDAVEMLFSEGPEGINEEDKWMYAQVSSLHGSFASAYVKDYGYRYTKSLVGVTTLRHLMPKHRCPTNLGFLSIDCEGEDLNVLSGIDFDRYRPRLICVESDAQNRHIYADFVEKLGYAYYAHTPGNTFFALQDDQRT